MSSNHPIFGNLRAPLGSGYPVSAKSAMQSLKQSSKSSHLKKPSNSSVQDEYVKNLQQQIYLLELETRYLKSPGSNGNGNGNYQSNAQAQARAQAQLSAAIASGNQAAIAASKQSLYKLSMESLNDPQNNTFENTDYNKTSSELKSALTEIKKLESTIKDLHKDKDELFKDIKLIKDRNISEKDKIYGELISTRKKYETAECENARLQISYDRVIAEKEQIQKMESLAQDEVKKFKDLVSEQLQINKAIKERVDELNQKNTSIESQLSSANASISNFKIDEYNAKVRLLEQEKSDLLIKMKHVELTRQQEDHYKAKVEQDCKDLIKVNVELQNQIDVLSSKLTKITGNKKDSENRSQDQIKEEEKLRNDLARAKDDLQMISISSEMKETQNQELVQQIKLIENNLFKMTEAKTILTEKITAIETRIRNQEMELIQLGQDKSLLIDEVAELRNNADVRTHKIKNLISDNKKLTLECDKYKKEAAQIRDFTHILEQVESNGQNYLQLMKNMKNYLHKDGKMTDSQEYGDINGEEHD